MFLAHYNEDFPMGQPLSFLSVIPTMQLNMFDNPDIESLCDFQLCHDGEFQRDFLLNDLQAGNMFSSFPGGGFVQLTSRLQRFGETSFVAAIILSMIQAAVALHQYRSNPSGELIFPQGLTFGIEEPSGDSSPNTYPWNTDWRGGNITLSTSPIEKWRALNEDANHLFLEQNANHKKLRAYRLSLFKLNRMLVLLFPWIARRINYLLIKNSHLFHIFFIISLASVFDFWHPRPRDQIIHPFKSLPSIVSVKQNEEREYKVVVIGDSLAIGIGCDERRDTNKNQTTPKYRVEKLSMDSKPDIDGSSPVFPRVFAKTLSTRLKRRVRWRSAGVDGGDVDDINRFCTGVIQEESEQNMSPDIVVILCGINDLKKAVSNPFKSKSARGFRASMENLINSIRQYAPDASILFPALPVQLFHKNSIVNILPLSFFLDTIIGFWDSQKKMVADNSPSNVIYVGLTAREILNWYDRSHGDEAEDATVTALIANDGVHPNSRCYGKWASSVANKFCDKIQNNL